MKIRFRYNGLFVLSCVAFVLLFIQQTQIHQLNDELSKYAKFNDVRKRSVYMNYQAGEIKMIALDAHALAEAAYDMAYEKMSRDQWMIGKTTEQIDSIRLHSR